MVNGLFMKRISFILGAILLLTGLGACSDLRVDTDLLTGAWVQVRAARIDDGAATYWVFQTDGILSISGIGSCIADGYSYTVKGKILELLPPTFSSAHYNWDKPFTFRILECTEKSLQLKLLSIPENASARISADTDIIELERNSLF